MIRHSTFGDKDEHLGQKWPLALQMQLRVLVDVEMGDGTGWCEMDFVIYGHTLDDFSEIQVSYVPKEMKKPNISGIWPNGLDSFRSTSFVLCVHI